MVQRPRNSPLAGLVFLGAVVALGLLASAVVRFGAGIRAPAEAEETQEANKWREAEVDALDEARDGFETQLVREMTAPGPAALPELPEGVSLVRYPSGDHTFPAWLSESEGEDRPAVLLLHDASGLDAALWKEAAVLREAGFVVMAPTLRAEHGNPGTFEWQYGEVDDVVAAGQYLAGLSNVDSDDISLVGVGSGGDLALLAAMVPGPFTRAAAIGADVDFEAVYASEADRAPFGDSADERRLRNPTAFVGSLRVPVVLYAPEGQRDLIALTQRFRRQAQSIGKSCDYSEQKPEDLVVASLTHLREELE